MTGCDDWEAFVNGSSADAAIRFADLYAASGDQPTLFNLGMALLDDANYEMAREAFDSLNKHMEELNEAAEVNYIYRGLVDWAEDRPAEAVNFWKKSLTAPYVDDGGGVTGPAFLWYAGARLRDEALVRTAEKHLRKFPVGRRALFQQHWPGSRAIGVFLLGEVDAETFSERWRYAPRDEVLEARRRCRTAFWIAAKATDPAERRRLLVSAVADRRAIGECEYAAAKIDLHRFGLDAVG